MNTVTLSDDDCRTLILAMGYRYAKFAFDSITGGVLLTFYGTDGKGWIIHLPEELEDFQGFVNR